MSNVSSTTCQVWSHSRQVWSHLESFQVKLNLSHRQLSLSLPGFDLEFYSKVLFTSVSNFFQVGVSNFLKYCIVKCHVCCCWGGGSVENENYNFFQVSQHNFVSKSCFGKCFFFKIVKFVSQGPVICFLLKNSVWIKQCL